MFSFRLLFMRSQLCFACSFFRPWLGLYVKYVHASFCYFSCFWTPKLPQLIPICIHCLIDAALWSHSNTYTTNANTTLVSSLCVQLQPRAVQNEAVVEHQPNFHLIRGQKSLNDIWTNFISSPTATFPRQSALFWIMLI